MRHTHKVGKCSRILDVLWLSRHAVTVARVFPKPSRSSLQLLMPLCTKEVVQVENLSNHVEFQVPFLKVDILTCKGAMELYSTSSQVD